MRTLALMLVKLIGTENSYICMNNSGKCYKKESELKDILNKYKNKNNIRGRMANDGLNFSEHFSGSDKRDVLRHYIFKIQNSLSDSRNRIPNMNYEGNVISKIVYDKSIKDKTIVDCTAIKSDRIEAGLIDATYVEAKSISCTVLNCSVVNAENLEYKESGDNLYLSDSN